MSLELIIKEIKALTPLANEDVDAGPVETLSGRRGRKNQALIRLQDLREQYTKDLIRSALFIIVTGSKRNEFSELATNKSFGLFGADPETFYRDLADRVHPSLYQGSASPSNLFDVLGRHLEDKMSELGLSEYNQLIFRETYIQPMRNSEEFSQVIKKAINEQVGSEIVGVQAANTIVEKAIASGHSSKVTPIVLNTGDEKFALQLSIDLERLTNRVFLVNTGKVSKELKSVQDSMYLKEVTETTVEATLAQINNSIKK